MVRGPDRVGQLFFGYNGDPVGAITDIQITYDTPAFVDGHDYTQFGNTTTTFQMGGRLFQDAQLMNVGLLTGDNYFRAQLTGGEVIPTPGELLRWVRTGEGPKAQRRRRTEEERQSLIHEMREYQDAVRRLADDFTRMQRDLGQGLIERHGLPGVTVDNVQGRVECELAAAEALEADERASWLLDQYLTDDQRAMFAKNKYFLVKGKSNTYQITNEAVVRVVDAKKKRLGQFCVYLSGAIPTADQILSYKLLLEASEEEFLRTANYSGYAPADGDAPKHQDYTAQIHRRHVSLGKLTADGKVKSNFFGADPWVQR